MKKSKLFENYEFYKQYSPLKVTLFLHMPDGSIETIINTNAPAKMKYIDNAYDDNLVLKNSPEIYIINAYFSTAHDFGYALDFLRIGLKVTRDAWNDDNIYVYYVPDGNYKPVTDAGKECVNEDGLVPYGEYLAIKNKDGIVYPYNPGMDSILAYDWRVVGKIESSD